MTAPTVDLSALDALAEAATAAAWEIVDKLRGYTVEFAADPAWHRREYGNVEEIIRTRLATALEAARVGEWLPIESAPEKGKVLLWANGWTHAPVGYRDTRDGDDESGEHSTFWGWAVEERVSGACEDDFIGWNEDIEAGIMPTHWRPLPSPHAEEKKT